MRSGIQRRPVKGYYGWRDWTLYRPEQGRVFAYKTRSKETCLGPFDTLNEAVDYIEKKFEGAFRIPRSNVSQISKEEFERRAIMSLQDMDRGEP